MHDRCAAPCLESRCLADEAEVDQDRHGAMTQPAEGGTSLHPSQLFRDATGAADQERHAHAGRKIEGAAIFVQRKPIGHELHERPTVQNDGPRRSRTTIASASTRQGNFFG